MVRFLLSLLIGWSISSWLITETFFFFPGLQPLYATVQEMLTIPRHDQWELERIEREQKWLALKLRAEDYTRRVSWLVDAAPQTASSSSPSQRPIVFSIRDARIDPLRDGLAEGLWTPAENWKPIRPGSRRARTA